MLATVTTCALVGIDAFRFLARESALVSQVSEQLKVRREELPERISSIVTRLRDAERDLQRAQSARLLGNASELAGGAADAGGAAYVAYQVPDGTPADGIRTVALDVRGRLASDRPGVVVVAGLFVYEHRLVSPTDLSRLDVAFFNVNGYIALIILAAVLGGRLL